MEDAQRVGIDGRTFDFGWIMDMHPNNATAIDMEVNTGQVYKMFRARLGLRDTGGTGEGKIAIVGDGRTLREVDVKVKTSQDVTLNITGIQRLQIKGYTPDGDVTYAVGDPVVNS